MANLETTVVLPPDPLPGARVRSLFELIFERFRWVEVGRFGDLEMAERIAPGEPVASTLSEFFARERRLTVEGKGGSFMLTEHHSAANVYTGALIWFTSERAAKQAGWREKQAAQVLEVAKLLDAPFAFTTLESEYRRKLERDVPAEVGVEVVLRGGDYYGGLLSVFWRNLYGPPFTEMFGHERLAKLPPEVARDCGDGYWLVEPYPLPQDAETDAGRQQERTMVEHLGKQFFYDFDAERGAERVAAIGGSAKPRG